MKHIGKFIDLFLVSILLTTCHGKIEMETDVLVIGGTTSGTSAGIQASRMGVNTIIVEETAWLGGMLSSAGVSAADGNHNLHSGIWNEFRTKLRKHYGGPGALATGWVSNTQFEPHVADSIFKSMASETEGLRILYGYSLTKILSTDNQVLGALFVNESGKELLIRASVVIDATDLGDALFLAGAGYDIGMEAKSLTGEANAPEESNNIIQDLTWVAILKDYGQGIDKTINKPANYNPGLYRGSCSLANDSILISCDMMLSYGRLPNDKFMINWPRNGNDIYLNVVEMTREERNIELKKAKDMTLGFLYYIQTELGFKQLGLADDEFPTLDKLAIIPYHREGRRLKGITRLTINNILDIYSGNPLYRTGISVGDYPVDHHHNANPLAPTISFPSVPSFNIPLGALIPAQIDGLVVSDKAISVSNIMNGATRLQPVVLLTGQAAGACAAIAVGENIKVRDVSIRKVQQVLLDCGAYLMPLFDIGPDDRDFQPIQRVTSSGILRVKGEPFQWANRTWFYPDSAISVMEFTEGLNSFENKVPVTKDLDMITVAGVSALLSDLLEKDISSELIDILTRNTGRQPDLKTPLTKRQLAIITDELVRPFETKETGFDGNYK